ncbi:hypothetical protein K458DRAFT_402078 [Lentithecium fluviatile CBS 122367]|uniref:Uncharacterized protein n=1 Tax=Lentithecium fluviatile CBS 122367 TaxID=1168545 RepID=A0A6G1J7E4_9PLEO|nr:hypothetical protein K458DRAFT_402078 [Lentithecium fluviatile CBS 122367]
MDNVMSFNNVQSQIMLHELFHLGYRSDRDSIGVSDPRCVDRGIKGRRGLAYGPARAKWLARATQGGPQVASTNNDNYVYFLISKWMTQRFGQYREPEFSAKLPKFGWPVEAFKRDDDALDDALTRRVDFLDGVSVEGAPEALPDFDIITDDAEFYGGEQDPEAADLMPTCNTDISDNALTTDAPCVEGVIDSFCEYLSNEWANMSCETPYEAMGYALTGSGSTEENLL